MSHFRRFSIILLNNQTDLDVVTLNTRIEMLLVTTTPHECMQYLKFDHHEVRQGIHLSWKYFKHIRIYSIMLWHSNYPLVCLNYLLLFVIRIRTSYDVNISSGRLTSGWITRVCSGIRCLCSGYQELCITNIYGGNA